MSRPEDAFAELAADLAKADTPGARFVAIVSAVEKAKGAPISARELRLLAREQRALADRMDDEATRIEDRFYARLSALGAETAPVSVADLFRRVETANRGGRRR